MKKLITLSLIALSTVLFAADATKIKVTPDGKISKEAVTSEQLLNNAGLIIVATSADDVTRAANLLGFALSVRDHDGYLSTGTTSSIGFSTPELKKQSSNETVEGNFTPNTIIIVDPSDHILGIAQVLDIKNNKVVAPQEFINAIK